jgi:trk system potassium uptake protein
VIIPNGNTIISAKDRLIIFCLAEDTLAIDKFLKPKKGGKLSELWNRN